MLVTVELQFTPTRTATAVQRLTVESAFRDVGVPITRWTVPVGEDEIAAELPSARFADPLLDIRLLVDDEDVNGYLTGKATFTLLPGLGHACSAIRAALPELPMGIDERVGDERRHLGFRHTDDSFEIARSFRDFPHDGLGEASLWAWSSDAHRWVAMIVTRHRAAAPRAPWRVSWSEPDG